jgi:hypothetical protein
MHFPGLDKKTSDIFDEMGAARQQERQKKRKSMVHA